MAQLTKTRRRKSAEPTEVKDTMRVFKELWLKRLELSAEKWSNNRA